MAKPKRQTVKITKRAVDALVVGESIYDNEVRGFRAVCLPSGRVTFGYQYTSPKGGRPYLALGLHGEVTVDQARTKAQTAAAAVANDRDPAQERDTERRKSEHNAASTVNGLLDKYEVGPLAALAPQTQTTVKSMFARLVRPKIGKRSIYDLKRSAINAMLDEIADETGEIAADRALAWLRAAFNWHAVRDDDFTSPIIKGMARVNPGDRARDRTLNDQEIRDFWTATFRLDGKAPPRAGEWLRSLLLTAQRRSNVGKAHAKQIDGDDWIIPSGRNGSKSDSRKLRSGDAHKNRQGQLVPMTAAVRELFGDRKGFIFSSERDGSTALQAFSDIKAAVDEEITAIRKADGREPMEHWTYHDLRRTARSIMSRYTSPDIAERVIGHTVKGVRAVYDLYDYRKEKAAALEKLAAHIHGIVNPPPENIVDFPDSGRATTATKHGRPGVGR